ncbi:MAG: MCP four helix bundle domain-containing protein [Paucibacter sp.]|nr:MCP four helix bundle domain-containing protein [Roseateles sp.]
MNLKHLSIGKRLALVLGLILALCLASSVIAITQLRRMSAEVQSMVTEDLQTERLASDWLLNTSGSIQRSTAIVKSSDMSLNEYFAPINAEIMRQTNEIQKKLEALMNSPEEQTLFARISDERKAYIATRDRVIDLKNKNEVDAARQMFQDAFEPRSKSYVDAIEQLMTLERQRLNDSAARVDALRTQTSLTLAVSGISALGLSVLLALYLTRSITRPLHSAQAMAGAIAAMDLTGRAQPSYHRDETGRLLESLDTMRAALQQALGQVREVADGVSTASTQIATGNADLSARTEHAASNLQQTAGAMEQLTGTVRHTADSARTAGQLASSAAGAAAEGGEVMRQVVATMGDISARSRKISDIIGVIDAIAFQTNILALNAAVEAARAGEQGRGFAVVASEVRTLAKRSADAAREIKTLIGSSVDKVELGVQLVEQAGASMGNIVSSVRRVSDIIAEIALASGEQSQGIGEVNTAVVHLDQMTQQNAALVEESSAAADSLRDQALRLSGVVGNFRLP